MAASSADFIKSKQYYDTGLYLLNRDQNIVNQYMLVVKISTDGYKYCHKNTDKITGIHTNWLFYFLYFWFILCLNWVRKVFV